MSTSPASHTQGIIGFQHQSYDRSGGITIQHLIRKEFRCPRCFNAETEFEKRRVIQDKLFLSDDDRYPLELEVQAESKL